MGNGSRKAATIGIAVLVVFTAVVGGTVALLTVGKPRSSDAYLNVAIGDRLTKVHPTQWCDLLLRGCRAATSPEILNARMPLPIGESAMVSVSPEIADQPWLLYALYADRNGTIINPNPEPQYQSSGETYTVTLPSTPDRVLLNIEVQPLSAVAQGDDQVVRGILALNVAPDTPVAGTAPQPTGTPPVAG